MPRLTRRSIVALSLPLLSFALVACEDGPNQSYNPVPAGAAGIFNNGNTDAAVDPGQAGFQVEAGGTNKVVLCDGPTKQKTWAAAFKKPILPPRQAAGLDVAGGETWKGLTIEEADKTLCQSDNFGDLRGDGTLFNGWGDNGEIYVNYRVSNHKIIGFLLFAGYNGTIDLTSRDGMHTYTIPVGAQIQKDASNFELHWASDKNYLDEASELYDAMIATFAPGFPADKDCQASRRCIIGSFGDVAYFYVPALASALWIPNRNAAQPAPSVVNRIDQDLAKVMPFSFANPLMKLDAVGPVANMPSKPPGAANLCSLKLGITYGNFLADCVKVAGDATKDQNEQNKLLGGLTHGTERFHFDVQGIDVNFTDKTLPTEEIIKDNDVPTPDDTATQFAIDQSTLGIIANDRLGGDPAAARDNHGAGLVYLEYARLVQEDLTKLILAAPASFPGATARTLGDPACLAGPGNSVSPTALNYAAGCTGFEGIVTSAVLPAAPPAGDALMKRNALGFANSVKVLSGLEGGLKPGHLQVAFCLDATGDVVNDYKLCKSPPGPAGSVVGAQGDIFSTSFARVLAVLGKGKVGNLPTEVQDVRFFFKEYVRALLHYMTIAGDATAETYAAVHAASIDDDSLFFDSIGAGQFEIGEYVDRRFASKTQDPTDIVVTADVKNGIFNGYNFSRDIFRGETALYASMREDQTKGIGQENSALLTNMFGSTLLNAAYKDIPGPNPTDPPATAYFCATGCNSATDCGHYDAAKCTTSGASPVVYAPPSDANRAFLLDSKGRPILAPYKGAFGSARTAWTLGPTPVTITKTKPELQSALVNVPLHKDPYDQTSDPPADPSISLLIPWIPKQPGVGFPVALTGTRDKFIESSQLDFSGTTISANVDYDIILDRNGVPNKSGNLVIKAVETTDFLGDVFLCRDDQTKDILSTRMYTPVGTILDWLAAHPGSYQACQIIIRYSPYGNYADYITSLTSGVRLGITQGGGFGRVVDVTLFTPGVQ